MKKCVYLVLLLGILSFSLWGCAAPDVPGTAWATEETLVFDVLRVNDGKVAKGVKFAEATSVLTRVSGTAVLKNAGEKSFSVSANATHFSMVTKNLDGEVIMESEFIMDGFKPVASYKSVRYGQQDYEYVGEYKPKYEYKYTDRKTGGVRESSLKTGGTYTDNEFLYMYIRCYALENISKSFNLLTPADDASTSISVKTQSEGKKPFLKPGAAEKTDVKITQVIISRTKTPVGKSIYATYTQYDPETDEGNFGLKSNKDYHLPLLIIENDVAYKLQEGDAIKVVTSK